MDDAQLGCPLQHDMQNPVDVPNRSGTEALVTHAVTLQAAVQRRQDARREFLDRHLPKRQL